MKKTIKKNLSSKELDKKFDDGKEDILGDFDLQTVAKRVIVDFPLWAVEEIDKEATRLGIARQAIIKIWIIERLDGLRKNSKSA